MEAHAVYCNSERSENAATAGEYALRFSES